MRKINLDEKSKAYLAGFLDGDGLFITQIVHNKERKYKFYFKISIIISVKSSNHWFIIYLQKMLKPYGFIRKRNNMSELELVEKEVIKILLKELYPYIVLKKSLVKLILNIINEIEKVESEADFLKVCKMIDETAKFTYSKKRKITYDYVKNYLDSPVETSSKNEMK